MSTPENEPKLVSRRTFLKKSAMISIGALAATTLSSCAPKAESSQAANIKWDKEVDVLVVGSGTVATAAIAAKEAGAKSVLVLEKGPGFGGTSALSGGIFWLPMNYAMKDAGIESVGSSPAEMDAFFREERDRWARIVRETGAKID